MASRKCILAAESHDSSGNKTRACARGRCGLSFIVPSDLGSGMDLSSLSTIKIKNLPGQPRPPLLPAMAGLRPNTAYTQCPRRKVLPRYRDNDIRSYRYLRAFIGAVHSRAYT